MFSNTQITSDEEYESEKETLNGSSDQDSSEVHSDINDLDKSKLDDDSDDNDSSDVWMSSEDVYTALSSPYYQSAAEDEDELNGVKSELNFFRSVSAFLYTSCFLQERHQSFSI